jgi:hypothetical protein
MTDLNLRPCTVTDQLRVASVTINPLPPSGHYMYRTVVTICTASLTFNNSTFCPHRVFMCFVWIWEQTAIISLYNINWLVCVTQMECVYCEVRTGSLWFRLILVFKDKYLQYFACRAAQSNAIRFLVGTSEGKRILGRFRSIRKNNVNMELKDILNWIRNETSGVLLWTR